MLTIRVPTKLLVVGGTLAILTLLISPHVAFAECPSGYRPATAADLPRMDAAGIPNPRVGECWKLNDESVGSAVADAKKNLRDMLCAPDGDNYGGAGPDATIEELNPQLTVCAAKFLAFAKQGRPVCIREGYRTVQKQKEYAQRAANGGNIACTLGAGCEHPSGIAIDIKTNSEANYQWLHQNACQFGLDFYLRFSDKVHFVPLSHSASRGKSTCGGARQATSCEDPNFTPRNIMGGAAPSSSFTDDLRQALFGSQYSCAGTAIVDSSNRVVQVCPYGTSCFNGACTQGYQQQPPLPPQPPPMQQPAQTQSSQLIPSPGTSASPTPATPVSSTLNTGSNVPNTTTQGGTTAGASTGASSGATTGTGASQTPATTPAQQKPSVAQQLFDIAYGTSGIATAAPAPGLTPISFSASDIAGIAGNEQTPNGAAPGAVPPGSAVSAQPTQTFVSSDLNFSGASPGSQARPSSTFSQILADLRLALLKILDILHPFGISTAVRGGSVETLE